MTSQWYMNVNKARPRHAPTWRKTFKWTHFTTILKREWISTVIVYVYEVIWSIHFHSIKWNYDNRIGESLWRSWCYLICIITRGLCSYNARLFNDNVTVIGVSYWRRREFPNYAQLHRGKNRWYTIRHKEAIEEELEPSKIHQRQIHLLHWWPSAKLWHSQCFSSR